MKLLQWLSTIALACSALLLVADYSREAPTTIPDPPVSKWDRHMLDLDRAALDEAYEQQIRSLFSTWMKDNTHQPARAMNGARQARHAYIAVMQEIERREAAAK